MFSSTGSMTTAASSSPYADRICSSRSRLLYGTTWTMPDSTSKGTTGVGKSSSPASARSGFTDTARASYPP